MIELTGVDKKYVMGNTTVWALRGVSIKISPGEFIAIIGPSGSGKSTLLHVLGFLDRPDSGQYLLNGEEISEFSDDKLAYLRNSLAGFVFQQFHLLPRLTALENVELPLIYSGQDHLKDMAAEKITQVGLSDRTRHRPNELSGGQQQRVAIARALVNEPLIIFADEPTGNLDTVSEQEIINILKTLNRAGKTVVMVTHEKEIADHAGRTICMRDGRIISDEQNKGVDRGYDKKETTDTGNTNRIGGFSIMELWDNLQQGFKTIFSNKMRSFLSMLGILIGVASVIAMLALGQGAKESISKSLASLGTNILRVRAGARHRGGVTLASGTVTRFTIKDADAIGKLPRVRRVSPNVRGRAQVVYGNKNWNTQLWGVGIDYPQMKAAVPVAGRFFTDEEMRSRQRVVLLGITVAKELFGDSNPTGQMVKLNRANFKVIGVLPEKGSSFHGDRDDVVVIPITTAMYRVLGKEYVDEIETEIVDVNVMDEASDSIKDLIIKRHRLQNKDKESFNIMNMAEIQETLSSMTRTMTMLLSFIAVISLIVGGIGIMNIMLVSVTERTREIGLRKAIGARKRDIMLQFLVESVIMTLNGGVLGIIFGAIIAIMLSVVAGWVTKVTLFSVVLATTFSVMVGLGFGLWPAYKASRLNPIEALRYE